MPKIARIDITPVSYRLRRPFKFFAASGDAAERPSLVVGIVADDGTVGWGQSVPVSSWSYETPETAIIALREYYAPALIGHDPLDIDGAMAAMDRVIAPAFSTGMPISRAGIDIALHDLAAKLRAESLATRWNGSSRRHLPLSWTVDARDPEETEQRVAAGQAAGYSHFNIKVGTSLDFDVAQVRLVRRLAPASLLWVDANCAYDPEAARLAARRFAEVGVDILESPLPPNQIAGYQALKKQGAVLIFMDEGVVSPVELEAFISLGMLDGVAMKPARCGGLHSCRRQIELIESHGLRWVGSGLCDPDISLAASLILFAASNLTTAAALNGPQFLAGSILKHPITVVDGIANVPTGPGLGIEVDPDKLVMAAKPGAGSRIAI